MWLRRIPFAVVLLLVSLISTTTNNKFAVSAADSATPKKKQGKKGAVTILNSKNFDSSLKEGDAWLIEFYAPWCGHCTRFASTYDQVAMALHADQNDPNGPKRKVNVGKVDGAAERALSSRFGVHGYPTFVLVEGWTVREFEGTRSMDGLIQFAKTDYEKTEPVPFLFGPFGPMGQLRSFLMRTGTWAIGLYDGLTQDRGMKPLMAMAVLCVGGLVAGIASLIVVGLLFLPKAKMD